MSLSTSSKDQYVASLYDPVYPGAGGIGTSGHELTIFQINNLQIGEIVRLFVLQIEVAINFILELLAAISAFIFKVIALLSPYLFVFIFFIFMYWLANVLFPYTMKFVVLVGIPVIDVIILMVNIIIKIVAFIYMILATIWNATVPFLGMILMFVFDIIFAILDAINQILGAIDLGSLFQELMPLINIIMELILQIVQVIIQVGEPILNALLQLVVPLLEVVFSVIKILLPIITFLIKVIFFVLQPIIFILQAFFGGGQSGSYGMEDSGSARKLLSVNLFEKTYDQYAGYEPYARTIMSHLNMTPGEFYTAIHQNDTEIVKDLWSVPQMTGRQPLSYETRKAGLRFMDEEDEDEEEEIELGKMRNLKQTPHDDDTTYGFVHSFYKSSLNIPKDTRYETFTIMDQVMEHYKERDPLTVSAIFRAHIQQNGYVAHDPKDRLGAVRYAAEIEHPNVLNERLKKERAAKRAEFVQSQYTGRKLLDMVVFPDNANEHLNHYMSNLERQHAMMIMEQAKTYKDKHVERMQLASAVTGAVSLAMKKHAETTFHPNNLMDQCNALMQTLGYKDLWDWHQQVVKEYASGEAYFLSLVKFFDNPLFNLIKRMDVNENDELYFKDWETERSTHDVGSGRRLFSVDEDNNMGTSDSRAALSGFATVSKQNCQTNPKHPLCVPIPPNSIFKFNIPLISLTQAQKDSLLQDTSQCSPWIKEVYCLFCWQRIYNAGVELVFLLSAIPPVNYALASLTRMVPWTGKFLDWIFIVPKFKRATTLQWLCFVKETYSLFSTLLFFWIIYYFLWPFVMVFVNTFRAMLMIRVSEHKSTGTVERLDRYFKNAFEYPQITPPQYSVIAGKISHDTHTHTHYHHNYGSPQDVQALLEFIQGYVNTSEARVNMRFERLLAYLGMYHYNLHVNHADHIDTDASKEEDAQLAHPHHPMHTLIEFKPQL